MRIKSILILVLVLITVPSAFSQEVGSVSPAPALPTPVLVFLGAEYYQVVGKPITRYTYTVENMAAYPNALFAAAPELAPCGTNKNSSRSWVDLFDQNGKRLYGFCALSDRDGLSQLWFAMPGDVVPPSWIYIEINDRKTNTRYKSNLAESTL